MDITGIDWVIASGESGPGLRAMEDSWVREIRDICIASDTAFHFKQWGAVQKKLHGRELDGRTWDECRLLLDAQRGARPSVQIGAVIHLGQHSRP